MFISVLDLFKLGIGPSSSHTVGPMVAAHRFRSELQQSLDAPNGEVRLRCELKGSLAHTGLGHGTDKAVILGLHGYLPEELVEQDCDELVERLRHRDRVFLDEGQQLMFDPAKDLKFDTEHTLSQHPNGMVFKLMSDDACLFSATYFSIGGGFIATLEEVSSLSAPIRLVDAEPYPYPFDSAKKMLDMAQASGLSIAAMKRANEVALADHPERADKQLNDRLNLIWEAMDACIHRGLNTEGELPGGLHVARRAKQLYLTLDAGDARAQMNDWLCAYAMAVNEENAAGHAVVTAPTNGAAGVIPAVLKYYLTHGGGKPEHVYDFLLTASAIGGLIKHRSSISGAEVGCQGEVGSAAAMAAAGLCQVMGGTPEQVENAAEIALEHHLGMTCDPVKGLVQIPCIERNGFGAIKAYTAASLALKGSGRHMMALDNCIEAMRQTGQEMSDKYKETALGGLAQSWTEC
ncbi:MAG: L-serine ammonia-lyase [Oleiphilaceae bacterium]|nr:L-serine ammonia-lyase [Oleiphilaceae bacterium]